MTLAATHLARVCTREHLASWENEGGAITSASERRKEAIEAAQYFPASAIDLAPFAGARRRSGGAGDTYSLKVLEVSLSQLVPIAMAAGSARW
jgi:hypothetical protein